MPKGPELDNLISVIVPCRNERQHIDAFCDSALRQQLPAGWRMEVLIADGDSDDGTREHLLQRCAADPRLVLVDNPGRIVSTGLNACIARARGGTIARMLNLADIDLPDYAGYALGYRVVHAYLKRTGQSVVDATFVPAHQIIKESQFFA